MDPVDGWLGRYLPLSTLTMSPWQNTLSVPLGWKVCKLEKVVSICIQAKVEDETGTNARTSRHGVWGPTTQVNYQFCRLQQTSVKFWYSIDFLFSGIDDAVNIARIASFLVKDGHDLYQNEEFSGKYQQSLSPPKHIYDDIEQIKALHNQMSKLTV